ncbi:hypothetical protein ABIB95_005848 [Bradyrhizobium sp. LA2.1]
MPGGSLRPNLGLNRKGYCHGSIRLKGRQCRSWSIVYHWRDNTVEAVAQT